MCIFVSHPPERSAIDCQIDHLHTINDWGETLQERISQQIQTQWRWRMKLRAPVIVFKSLHQFEAMGFVEANSLTILCLGQKELFLEPCLFLFNTWTSTMIGWCVWQRICFNSSLAIPFLLIYCKNNVFKNKEGTAPVTDQNSESKYMNSTVCIFLHWGIRKCLQNSFSKLTSQTTAPTVFSFRLAKKPRRLVPTLHRVSWNFNQTCQHFNKHFKRLALEAFYRRPPGMVLEVH